MLIFVDVWLIAALFRYSATCYAWCSPEGDLPQPTFEVNDELTDEVIGNGDENRVVDVELSEQPVSHPLSPSLVYKSTWKQVRKMQHVYYLCSQFCTCRQVSFLQDSNLSESCGEKGRCRRHYQFKW